mmetsp:Transcript_6644/g.13844  ORF Transcript_6644/g.13844 Transcript_6644/m.13844 type:complete len:263 (-) Transcript_6644:245-1033(-)
MNRTSQSSRRSSFALLSIDLIEEPEIFSDEHLHEKLRSIQVDIEDNEDQILLETHTHVPSWGTNHRRRRHEDRQSSSSCRSESSNISEITNSFLSTMVDENLQTNLNNRNLAPSALRSRSSCISAVSFLSEVMGEDSLASFDSIDQLTPMTRDSVTLAGRRGVPKSNYRGFQYDEDADFESSSFKSETFLVDTFHDGDQDENDEQDEVDILFGRRDSLSLSRARIINGRNSFSVRVSVFSSHDDYHDDDITSYGSDWTKMNC